MALDFFLTGSIVIVSCGDCSGVVDDVVAVVVAVTVVVFDGSRISRRNRAYSTITNAIASTVKKIGRKRERRITNDER